MTFRNQLRFYGRLKVSVSCLSRSIQFAQSKRIYHNHHSDHRARLNRRTHTTSAPPLSLPSAASACMAFRRSRSIRLATAQACISRSCLSAISLMILSASFRSIPPPQIFKDFQRFSPNKLMKRFCPGQLLVSFDQASQ